MNERLRRLLVRLHLRKPRTYEQEILADSPLNYWRLDGRDEGVVYHEPPSPDPHTPKRGTP